MIDALHDLMPFCAGEDDEMRVPLRRPFTQGEYTFATNGHILVRVPARPGCGNGGPDMNKLGRYQELLALLSGAGLLDWQLLPAGFLPADCRTLPGSPAAMCTTCKGSGWIRPCADCEGEGSKICTCVTCNDEHRTACEKCNGDGCFKAQKGDQDAVECDDEICEAGIAWPALPAKQCVRIGASWFDEKYVAAVRALPGPVEVVPNDADTFMEAMFFRFAGGIGLLMPMRGMDEAPAP